jgi:hypothetical protein
VIVCLFRLVWCSDTHGVERTRQPLVRMFCLLRFVIGTDLKFRSPSLSRVYLPRTILGRSVDHTGRAYLLQALSLRLIILFPDTEFQPRFTYLCDRMQSSFHLQLGLHKPF